MIDALENWKPGDRGVCIKQIQNKETDRIKYVGGVPKLDQIVYVTKLLDTPNIPVLQILGFPVHIKVDGMVMKEWGYPADIFRKTYDAGTGTV